MNKKKLDAERDRIERFDRAFKDKFVTALILAPTLSVMILSVIYQTVNSSLISIGSVPGIALGWLTLVAVAASLTLAVIHNKSFVTMFLSVLFVFSSVSYGIVLVSGTANVLEDGFFDMLISVFVLPVISFMSVTGVGGKGPHIAPLIISVLVMAASIGSTVFIHIKRKKAEKESEREAEARKSDNRRRKV